MKSKSKIYSILCCLIFLSTQLIVLPSYAKPPDDKICTSLTLKVDPSRVVNQHYTKFIAKLEIKEKGKYPLSMQEVKFYLLDDSKETYIGSAYTDSEGYAIINYFIDLEKKNYRIIAKYSGNDIYAFDETKKPINIVQESMSITFTPISSPWADETIFTARITNPVGNPIPNRNISIYLFYFHKYEYIGSEISDEEGYIQISYQLLPPVGFYDVKVRFDGGHFYGIGEYLFPSSVEVLKRSTTILNDLNFTIPYSDLIMLDGRLWDHENLPVPFVHLKFYLYVNENWEFIGECETSYDGSGFISYTANLKPDDYILKVLFEGDDLYLPSEKYGILNITKEKTMLSFTTTLSMKYSDTLIISGKLTDDETIPIAGRTIDFFLKYDNSWHNIGTNSTNNNGEVSINYEANQIPAIYPIKIVFSGDIYYFNSFLTNNLEILKENILISVPDNEINYGETLQLSARLKDDESNPIPNKTINFYVYEIEFGYWILIGTGVTNTQGWAYFTYTATGISGGIHPIKASFTGDDYFNGGNGTDGLTVLNEPVIMTRASDDIQASTVGTTIKFAVKLQGVSGFNIVGASVTFTITYEASESYSNITNLNGIAQISYTFLDSGIYTISAYFPGSIYYSDQSFSFSICQVKQPTPSILYATFASCLDYSYNDLDVNSDSVTSRNYIKGYLDNEYTVRTYYDSLCTENNILNSLEYDQPIIFQFQGHGEQSTLVTDDYRANNPDKLTPAEIRTIPYYSRFVLAFTIACESMNTDDLAQAFIAIGADVFIGFLHPVKVITANYFGVRFYYYAINRDFSIQQSYNSAKADVEDIYINALCLLALILLIAGIIGIIAAIIFVNPYIGLAGALFIFIALLLFYGQLWYWQPRLYEASGVDADNVYI